MHKQLQNPKTPFFKYKYINIKFVILSVLESFFLP